MHQRLSQSTESTFLGKFSSVVVVAAKEPEEYENHFQNMLPFFFEVHPPKTYSSNSTFSPNLVYCVLKEWIRISSIVHAKIDGNPVGGLRTL